MFEWPKLKMTWVATEKWSQVTYLQYNLFTVYCYTTLTFNICPESCSCMQRVVSIVSRTHQVYSTRVYWTISKLFSAKNGICTGLS